MIERRFIKGAEIRTAESGHIEGHAAVFGEEYVLCDYPDFRVVETIKAGAFKRAVSEKQDVRGLFNHDASLILGRTSAGTLILKEDQTGLFYDCDPPDTQVGRDVRTLIQRRDITGCSFSFSVKKQTRTEEEVDGKTTVTRQIEDVDLYDVGPVTFPAYEGTDVAARTAELRGIFPDGIPQGILTAHPEFRDPRDGDDDDELPESPDDPGDGDDDDIEECLCRCRACYDGECEQCDDYMAECGDAERCNGAMRSARMKRADAKKTKRVDGEDLSSDAFAYVGDPEKTATWKLPIKFSTEEKTKSHIQNALARFSQTQGIPDSEKPKVLAKIKAAAKAHGIHVSDESNASSASLEHAQRRTATLLAEMSLIQ